METMPDLPELPPARKKLLYRSWYRGNREMDNVLGHYAIAHLASMDEPALETFREFLEENDIDLWNWVSGQHALPPEYAVLITDLCAFQQSRFGA